MRFSVDAVGNGIEFIRGKRKWVHGGYVIRRQAPYIRCGVVVTGKPIYSSKITAVIVQFEASVQHSDALIRASSILTADGGGAAVLGSYRAKPAKFESGDPTHPRSEWSLGYETRY